MADTFSDTAAKAARQASDAFDKAKETGRQMLNQGAFESAQDYMERGRGMLADSADNLSSFVRREPWLALATAFVMGYVAAQIIKRLP